MILELNLKRRKEYNYQHVTQRSHHSKNNISNENLGYNRIFLILGHISAIHIFITTQQTENGLTNVAYTYQFYLSVHISYNMRIMRCISFIMLCYRLYCSHTSPSEMWRWRRIQLHSFIIFIASTNRAIV